MSATRVDVSALPKEVLGDLQVLISTSKKDYITIGNSYYEIYPTSATVLMEAMSLFTKLLEAARIRKAERLQKIDGEIKPINVIVTTQDLIADPEAGEEIKKMLGMLLQGVNESDFSKMNIGQMFQALDKVIKINVDTLPASFQQELARVDVIPDIPDEEEEITNP